MRVPADFKQLEELRDKHKLISYFEVKGRELILYWRSLPNKAEIKVDIDLMRQAYGDYQAGRRAGAICTTRRTTSTGSIRWP